MTSNPASRRARAMTLAPRSCPSRPGLATTTRYRRSTSRLPAPATEVSDRLTATLVVSHALLHKSKTSAPCLDASGAHTKRMPPHPTQAEWDANLRGENPLGWPDYKPPEDESVVTGRTEHYAFAEGRFDVMG